MVVEQREKIDEKRKFERVDFREPVEFLLKEPFNIGGSLAFDVSEGGIKINFNDFIPVKSEVELRVKLGSQAKQVSLLGRVAWIVQVPYSDRYQVGLDFDLADPDTVAEFKKEVHQYIQTRRF